MLKKQKTMKKIYHIAIMGLIVFGMQSCKNETKKELQNDPIKTEVVSNTTQDGSYCFKNEFLFKDNPEMKDVQELKFTAAAGKVKGRYNWLPAEKDQRKGSFVGTIENNIITAEYSFKQEGQDATSQIKIIISDDQAIISGGDPALGLNAEIKKIDCDTYKL